MELAPPDKEKFKTIFNGIVENCGDILAEKEDIGEIKAFVSELRAKYQKELLYNLKEENIHILLILA